MDIITEVMQILMVAMLCLSLYLSTKLMGQINDYAGPVINLVQKLVDDKSDAN